MPPPPSRQQRAPPSRRFCCQGSVSRGAHTFFSWHPQTLPSPDARLLRAASTFVGLPSCGQSRSAAPAQQRQPCASPQAQGSAAQDFQRLPQTPTWRSGWDPVEGSGNRGESQQWALICPGRLPPPSANTPTWSPHPCSRSPISPPGQPWLHRPASPQQPRAEDDRTASRDQPGPAGQGPETRPPENTQSEALLGSLPPQAVSWLPTSSGPAMPLSLGKLPEPPS